MAAKKPRTIYYSRAQWIGGPVQTPTLATALMTCLNGLPSANHTQLPVRSGQAVVKHRRPQPHDDTLLLHIASWTPGEKASTVPHTKPDLDVADPPPNEDFLDGDAMLLIRENHVLVVTSGLRSSPVEYYLKELLKTCNANVTQFELLPIANRGLLQQIRSEGIRQITLGLSQYTETFNIDEPTSFKSQIGHLLNSLLMNSGRWERINEDADFHASLSLRSGHVSRGGLTADEMADLAQEIALDEDDEIIDDAIIETRKGSVVSRSELKLRRRVRIDSHGKTVSYVAAWQELEDYLEELEQTGALEY